MDAHQKEFNTNNSHTHRFMDKLKRRFDPLYGNNSKLNSLNLGSSVDDVSMMSRKPYSTRNRSIQHTAIRAESITEALQGNVSAQKRSKDHLSFLNDKSLFSTSHVNPVSNSPMTQKATKVPYKTKLK